MHRGADCSGSREDAEDGSGSAGIETKPKSWSIQPLLNGAISLKEDPRRQSEQPLETPVHCGCSGRIRRMAQVVPSSDDAIESGIAAAGWKDRVEAYRQYIRVFAILSAWLVFLFVTFVGTKNLMPYFVYEIDAEVINAVNIRTLSKEVSFAWPFAPGDSLDETDQCTILITNPCKPPYQGPHREGCQKESVTGFGVQSYQEDGNTLMLVLRPTMQWPSLPETWSNEVWCNVLLVVEETRDIVIETQSALVFAENVRLKSLKLKNNGGKVWLQAENLTVAQELTVQASNGGVLLQGLNMPSEAAATIDMNAGSVDITTDSSPSIAVESISDAVCLVGTFASYIPPSQINSTKLVRNNTVLQHRAVLQCPSTQACRQPKWQVSVGSESSSVGIQTLGAAGATVHSGNAFKDGFFAKLYPTPSKVGFEIISLKGSGIMRSSLQMIVSEKKVWLALGNWFSYYLALYGLFSWFTVMPTWQKHQATIAFCPAHGYPSVRDKKNLVPPMNSILAQAKSGLENPEADLWMMTRNLGGVQDGFTLKDYAKGIGVTMCCPRRDKMVPDCGYCSDPKYYSCTQRSGNFKGFTGKCEGFPKEEGCAPKGLTMRANMFTFYPRSFGGSCFQGDEVAALMTDRKTFFDFENISRTGDITMSDSSTCLTTAGLTSYVDGHGLFNHYESGSINSALVLSFLIGAIVGVFVIRSVYMILYKPGRVNFIVQSVLLNKEALAVLMRIMTESERFVIVDDSCVKGEDEEQQSLTGKRILCQLSVNKLPPPRTIVEHIKVLFGFQAKSRKLLKPAKIEDLSTARWVHRAMHLAYLRPDDAGYVKEVWDWDKSMYAEKARIIYLDGESQIEWNDDVSKRLSKLQRDTFKMSYLVQRLQIETNVPFFVGCAAISRESTMIAATVESNPNVDTTPNVPQWWIQIGKDVRSWAYPTTFIGELCYIALHFAFNLLPLLILYSWIVNLLYIEVLEKGLAVYGVGTDAAAFQEYTVPATGFYIALTSFAVLVLYYNRTKSWWDPEEAGFTEEERDMAKPSCDEPCVRPGETANKGRDTRFWYDLHDKVTKTSIVLVYSLEYAAFIFLLSVSCVWVILGMFLEPTKVAPYASAVTGLIAHTASMASRLKAFLDDCKMQLKKAIEDFEEKLLQQIINNVKHLDAAIGISEQMQAVSRAAELQHASNFDSLSGKLEAANAEEAKSILIEYTQRVLEPILQRMDIPWSQAVSMIQEIPEDEVRKAVESGNVGPILLKMSKAGLPMPADAKELLVAQIEPLVKSHLEQMGYSWRQAVAAFDRIPADVLKESLVTGNVAPILAKLTSVTNPLADMKGRHDAARVKMQEAVAVGRKEIKMYEVTNMLRKFGLSPQDIFLSVALSVILLCLVFLFLFIGMSAFTGVDADAGQSAVNSLITGGAALVTNLSGSGNSSQKLRKIIDLAIEEYKKTRMSNTLSFSMDEDLSAVMNRASKVKEDTEDQNA